MYFVHNHTALPIRPDQPCNAGESQLRAGSAITYNEYTLSQVGSRRKRCPGQFGQDGMGSIPAAPSMKHTSCFPPSSMPASIEISIKLIVCTYLFIRVFQKILQESYPPGPRLRRHVYSSISPFIQNCQSSTIVLDQMLQFGTYRVETRTSGIRRGIPGWYLQVIYVVKHVQCTAKYIQYIY
jgi:hypothetical protein